MSTRLLTKNDTTPAVAKIEKAREGFPALRSHKMGKAIEMEPSMAQLSRKHHGTILGCTTSAMYSHGMGPIAQLIDNRISIMTTSSTTLKKNMFASGLLRSKARKIRKAVPKLAVDTSVPTKSVSLRPRFLMIWMLQREPASPTMLTKAGNILSSDGMIFSVSSGEYCITVTPPSKCCWPIRQNAAKTARELFFTLLSVICFICCIFCSPFLAPSASINSISISAWQAQLKVLSLDGAFCMEQLLASMTSFKIQSTQAGSQMNQMASLAYCFLPFSMYHLGVSSLQKYAKLMSCSTQVSIGNPNMILQLYSGSESRPSRKVRKNPKEAPSTNMT